MSLNAFPLQKSLVLPATLDLSKRPYAVHRGYRNRTFRRFNPSGSATDYTGGVNWSISIPDGVGLCRRAYMQVDFRIPLNLESTAGGQTYAGALKQNEFALRAYPLNRSIASEQITINNNTYTQNPRDFIDLLVHSLDDEVHKINCLNSVYRRDNTTGYNQLQGSQNSPLRDYADGTYQSPARGSGYFDLVRIEDTAVGTADVQNNAIPAGQRQVIVQVRVVEAVLTPPFFYEKTADQPAIFGADTLEMQVNWVSLSNSVSLVCAANYAPVPSVGARITPNGSAVPTSPFLYLEYFTPHIGMSIPREIAYDIFEMTAYTQAQNPNLGASATAVGTLSNNNIKLSNSTPTRLFVFVREDPNNLGTTTGTADQMNTANYFYPITGVNITFNNQTGLLSSATQEQLWDLSRSNGLEQEFEEFVGRSFSQGTTSLTNLLGGILSIDPSKDLALEEGNANGVQGDNQLSIDVSIRNHTGSAVNRSLQLVVVALYESILNVKDRSMFSQSKGVLSAADVIGAQALPVVYEQQIGEMYGGKRTLGTKVGKFFKKVGDMVKSVAKSDVGKRLGKMAQDKVAKMAEKALMGQGMTGAGLTGGRSMGRQQLLAMLDE